MTNSEIWKAALGEIELSISKAQFNTWFRNTSILSIENSEVLISVPNGFAKEWLENKFNLIILRAINNVHEGVKSIVCQVNQDSSHKKPITNSFSGIDGVQIRKLPKNNSQTTEGEFQRKKISSQQSATSSNLNTRYTFNSFIVGSNNELARAACLAVAENPGQTYNPLFIYGGVGLGKTHLLQSIGNSLIQKYPTKKVLYTTSEKFTYELIASIKNHEADVFKKHYQDIDLLIIDDVQFLSGKEKTQYEFFNIFNALYQLNKQIVISSDRPPKAIPTLEDRLRSRFEGGMIADISRPDLETRIAILSAKSHQKNFILSEDIIRYIADNITQNIRELEGALNRIIAIHQLSGTEITLDTTKNILTELIESNKKKGATQKEIINAVCDYYSISSDELSKKGRKKEIAHPRQVAMYLIRQELQSSYTNIGRIFGGRDHTTALHAFEKIQKETEKDQSRIKEEIEMLREKIYSC